MTDLIRTALQYGFETTNDDGDMYACGEAQLFAFAKACERKGMADVVAIMRANEAKLDALSNPTVVTGVISGAISAQADMIEAALVILDAELAMLRDAEAHVEIAPKLAGAEFCAGGVDVSWDRCPKCGATSDDLCRYAR